MRLMLRRVLVPLIALGMGGALALGPATAAAPPRHSDPAALALPRRAEPIASGSSGTAGSGRTAMIALAATVTPTGVSAPVAGELCDGDSGHQYYVDATADGHFAIYYTLTGSNKITASYLGDVEGVLANVWSTEIDTMGFEAPLVPGGGTRTPIFLCDIAPGYYGYCSPVHESGIPSYAAAAECTLRNNYSSLLNPRLDGPDPLAPLKVTTAHEFQHATQFRQVASEPLWLMEGTAVWMENEVYPTIHDYLQYLPATGIKEAWWPFNVPVTNPDTFDANPNAVWPFTVYGDFSFFKFLAGYLHDTGVVKEMWEYLGHHPTYSAMTALKVAATSHGHSLNTVLLNWALWNTLPPNSYPSRSLYGPVGWWTHVRLDRATPTLTTRTARIRPLADVPIALGRGSNVAATTRLTLTITGPTPAAGGYFTVQKRMANGTNTTAIYALGTRGSTVTVPFNSSVSYVVVTLNNLSAGATRTFTIRGRVS